MAEYINRNDALKQVLLVETRENMFQHIKDIPAADVVEEENILKFYYVRSIDEYWIGRRIGNFYYAEYDPESCRWIWTHSRYLPWGKHIVSPTSLWKEHTYPSEPEEIPFEEWLQGFVKKHAADVVGRKTGKWIYPSDITGFGRCSKCKALWDYSLIANKYFKICPRCGSYNRGENDV